ncbi:MAG: hypothetical protein JWO33_1354 [Caulobacteraceae bacterium]|nr:hypothetical protein [Caulobacteraceae bacterium]
MIEEEAAPRRQRGAALGELAREDLEVYAVEDLEERIEALTAEIARTQARLERKRSGRSAADSLFKI